MPVTGGDVATVQIGPDTRRGIAERNGEGEVAGGVIVMREGKNAREVIDGVRTKLAELKRSLPPGVEIVTTYDRSGLIDRAVDNLTSKLVEEFIIVGLVCALFLWHRSEEHTSELQSLMRISYAVCCLKKKNKSKY